MREPITDHVGNKYLRQIKSCLSSETIPVDVYNVLTAFEVEDHAVAHAIKKLLCLGKRGTKDRKEDLEDCLAAINRALDEESR